MKNHYSLCAEGPVEANLAQNTGLVSTQNKKVFRKIVVDVNTKKFQGFGLSSKTITDDGCVS